LWTLESWNLQEQDQSKLPKIAMYFPKEAEDSMEWILIYLMIVEAREQLERYVMAWADPDGGFKFVVPETSDDVYELEIPLNFADSLDLTGPHGARRLMDEGFVEADQDQKNRKHAISYSETNAGSTKVIDNWVIPVIMTIGLGMVILCFCSFKMMRQMYQDR